MGLIHAIALEPRLLFDANPLIYDGGQHDVVAIENLAVLLGLTDDSMDHELFFESMDVAGNELEDINNADEMPLHLGATGEINGESALELQPTVSGDAVAAHSAISYGSVLNRDELPNVQIDALYAPSASSFRVTRELVVVDESVHDFAQILDVLQQSQSTSRDFAVLSISSDQDGIEEITNFLKQSGDIDAIHIISHGAGGELQLGSAIINDALVSARTNDWIDWRTHLSADADILIYACDVAANDIGLQLIDRLAALTGADIAASDDVTGHFSLGGDWELEHHVGQIDATIAVSDWSLDHWQGLLATTSGNTAIWSANADTSPNAAAWNGSSFGSVTDTASVGSWRIIDGAESPTRDEKIVVGVDASGVISAEIYSGGSWAAVPFSLATAQSSNDHGFDIAYERQSGDAVLVWNNGTSGSTPISYRVWNGIAWSAEQTISTPVSGGVAHLELASNPSGDQMAMIVNGQDPAVDFAMIWNGSSWGNPVTLDSLAGAEHTDVSVAFESLSGRALVTYDANASTSDVQYRLWDGSTWSTERQLSAPAGVAVGSDVSWARLVADPNSDQIALGVLSDGNEVWFAVWDGSTWGSELTATTNVASTASLNLALAFESNTGNLLAAYSESATTSVSYRTWTSGGGWSAEQSSPNLGAVANAMTLSANPNGNQIMLSVQDNNSDLHFLQWDGTSWGSVNTLETNTGETAYQPFLFLYDTSPNADPVITSNGGGASASVNIAENNTLVTTVTASDADLPPQTLNYGIIGGVDATKFTIDSSTGVLSFVAAPNYESPTAAGGGNTYDVIVQVSDGIATDSQSIAVTVTNVNEAPVNATVAGQSTAINTPLVFDTANGNLVSISDVDAGAGLLQVTLTATNGRLSLSWATGTAISSGGEFRINTTTSDRQAAIEGEFYGETSEFGGPRAVASDPSGNFVVTWSSKNQDGDGWGVYAQRYNAAGIAQGGEFRVNTTTSKEQVHSTVAIDDSGKFVIVWSDKDQDGNGWGIFGQRFDASGTALGSEFQVNTVILNNQLGASIAMAPNGNFIVTWSSKDQDLDGWGVYAQRYTASGLMLGGAFRVNNTFLNDQTASSVAMDADGDFVVTWASKNQDGDNWGIYAKRYDATGLPRGSEFLVNSTVAKEQEFSSVAMDADGNFVITWSSKDLDGDNWGVFAQRYNSAGVAQGGEFQVNLTTSKEQMHSSVAMDVDGDFVISWTSNDQDGNGRGVYARQYDAIGVAKGGETLVNSTTSGDQEYSSVAMDARGGFVVVWTGNGPGDGLGVFGQRFAIPSGLTFTSGDGVRDTTMTFTGSLSQINAALDGLVFTPNQGFVGLATITLQTDDQGNSGSGGPESDSDTYNILVGGINVAPAIAFADGPLNFTENDPPTVIDSGITVNDPDSANFDGGQLVVFFSGNGTSHDRLAIRDQGVGVGQIGVSGSNVTYDFGAGPIVIGTYVGGTDGLTPLVITLNANANLASVRSLARNIVYENVSQDPSTSSRSVDFLLTDGDGGTSNIESKTIVVTAANDIPTINDQSFNVSENAANGTSIGFVVASDPDSGAEGILVYSIVGGTGATAFGIDSVTGEITVADTSQLDFETTSTFTLQVQVTDGGTPSLSSTGTITVNLLGVNEAPTDISPTSFGVAENTDTTSGLNLGAFVTTDQDAGDTVTYTILPGGDAAKFSLGGAAGDELILTDGTLDFESISVYSFTLRATDSVGNFIDQVVTVNVSDLNEVPLIVNQSFDVNENSANGTVVGTAAATDPDSGANGTLNFAITGGTGATAFAINATTGEITVADANQLDFETTTTFTLQVQATDGGSPALSATATITLNLLNVNEAPTDIAPDNLTIAENTNTAGGVSVGVLTAADADVFETFTYSIQPGGDGTLFSIGGIGSDELVLDDGVIDFERQGSYSVTIRVTDSAANFYDETITVSVIDQDENPTAAAGGPYQIDEGNGVLLDGSGSSDPEGNPLTYRWDLNNDGIFGDAVGATPSIDWTTLNAWGITNQGSHSVGLQVLDIGGNAHAVAATIIVNNVAPNAQDDAGPGFATQEDSAFVTANLLSNDTDPNDDDTLAVMGLDLSGTRGSVIDNGDGTITYSPNGQFEYLNDGDSAFDSFNYILADETGAFVFGTVTVTINGVNDEQLLTTNRPLVVAEGTSGALIPGILNTTDVDDLASDINYRITRGPTYGHLELASDPNVVLADFSQSQINNGEVLFIHDGSESQADSFDFIVDDGIGTASVGTFSIEISPVNDAPVARDDALFTAQGNSLIFAWANLTANDTDVDSSDLTPVIVAGPAHGTLVTNPNGSITYLPSANFNGTDSFQYMVSDGAAISNSATVIIQVAAVGIAPTESAPSTVTTSTNLPIAPEAVPPAPTSPAYSPPSGTADQSANMPDSSPPPVRYSMGENFDSSDESVEANSGAGDIAWFKMFVGSGARATDVELVGISAPSALRFITQPGAFWNALDGFCRDAEGSIGLPIVITGSAAAFSTTISVGYAIWLIRGGQVLAALMAHLPAWLLIDPLPILGSFEKRDDDSGESLQSYLDETPTSDLSNKTDLEHSSTNHENSPTLSIR